MASTSKDIQPIAHQSNIDTRKTTLNYEAIKKTYFKHVQNNPELLIKTPLCTNKGIEEKIKQITRRRSSDFIVKNVDGKKTLYIKRNDHRFKEVLSVEDAFDIVLDTHVACNHSNAASTYEKLTGLYSVPIFCVCWLVSSCNVCSASAKVDTQMPATKLVEKVSNNPSRRGLWRLNIIRDDVLIRNDGGPDHYLLIFKEDSTNFVLLRPLFENCEELAMELSKMFTEFGFPDKVYVPNMLNFYAKIFHMANLINGVAAVSLDKATDVDIFMKDKDEVLNEIKNWMDTMHDVYWEQSCYFVQYKLNTTRKRLHRMFKKEEIYGIPFNLFFEYRFRTKMTWVEPPFYKKIKDTPSPTDTITLE